MVLVFLNIQNSCTWTFSSNAARIAQSCYKVYATTLAYLFYFKEEHLQVLS